MSVRRILNILDVIKYEGDNSTFIWKHPCEDFHTNSKLIVHESQEAIFLANGQAFPPFGPGRYDLETENHVFTQWLKRTFITNGIDAFHCEVYFINKTVQMALKWGTDSKVRFAEPTMGIPVELGASGEMNLQISDGAKLLHTLVGTMNGIAWENEGQRFTKSLQASFRPLISTAVKSNLSSAIKQKDIDIVEIDAHLEELSEALREKILPGFETYGLTIPQFYITNIVLPETDANFRRLRELHTITLQKRMTWADADIRTVQVKSRQSYMTAEAEAEAAITVAKREAILESQTTETEIARREAERKLIQAQTEAQSAQMKGMAEAAVMQAKGYNQKDVLQAEVQKAYADGIGNMGPAIGTAGGGSVMGDMMSMGVTMAAMNNMMPYMQNMMQGMTGVVNPVQPASKAPAAEIACSRCGKKLPGSAKFCPECGTRIEQLAENDMLCPVCGKKTPRGRFCMECGASLSGNCPKCGAEVPQGGKFCLECGVKLV